MRALYTDFSLFNFYNPSEGITTSQQSEEAMIAG